MLGNFQGKFCQADDIRTGNKSLHEFWIVGRIAPITYEDNL